MPEGSFNKATILCPFYRNDEKIRRRIVCEGLQQDNTISLTWTSESGYSYQLDNFCGAKTYKGCPIYIMLMKEKYEEEI